MKWAMLTLSPYLKRKYVLPILSLALFTPILLWYLHGQFLLYEAPPVQGQTSDEQTLTHVAESASTPSDSAALEGTPLPAMPSSSPGPSPDGYAPSLFREEVSAHSLTTLPPLPEGASRVRYARIDLSTISPIGKSAQQLDTGWEVEIELFSDKKLLVRGAPHAILSDDTDIMKFCAWEGALSETGAGDIQIGFRTDGSYVMGIISGIGTGGYCIRQVQDDIVEIGEAPLYGSMPIEGSTD